MGWDAGKSLVALGACALLIETGLLMIMGLGRPASHVPEYIAYYLLTSIPYVVACWLVLGNPSLSSCRRVVPWVWAAALVLRLTVLPLAPSLSEDTARYRWLGMLQEAGGDPYLDLPQDPEWAGLRDETWSRVTGKDKPSAYGPVVELINRWHYRIASHATADPWTQVWLFKLPFAIADLLVGLALMSLLAALGRPLTWVLVYLWSPLPVTEFWIEGHNDSVALVFAVAALALAQRQKSRRALASLAVATMCKFWPVVLLPFLVLTRREGRWSVQWTGGVAFVAVGACLWLPYWDSLAAVEHVLTGFTEGWRNNDSLFALFLRVAGGDMGTASDISKWVLLAAVALARFLPMRPLAGELTAISVLLLVSANCLPWYLTWMLPLLAVHAVAPLLLWTVLVSLAYHVVPGYEANGIWEYDSSLLRMEYVPTLTWLAGIAALGVRNLIRSGARPAGPAPPDDPSPAVRQSPR